MNSQPEIEYLAIGHVCKDLTPGGPRLGGSVAFSALTARALGLRAAILTSTTIRPQDSTMRDLMRPLDGLAVHVVPSDEPTTFENIYRGGVRAQILGGRAARLTPAQLPPAWRQARIVHLAPVAQEVSREFLAVFPGALVAATPQGWMRQWDAAGRVSFCTWADASPVLGQLAAVVLSIEDVGGDEALIEQLAQEARLLAVTRGVQGSDLYVGGRRHHIPAPTVPERDPTGAGDIYAAAFLYRLAVTGEPLEAACFATALASASVTREGLQSVPTPAEIARALAQ